MWHIAEKHVSWHIFPHRYFLHSYRGTYRGPYTEVWHSASIQTLSVFCRDLEVAWPGTSGSPWTLLGYPQQYRLSRICLLPRKFCTPSPSRPPPGICRGSSCMGRRGKPSQRTHTGQRSIVCSWGRRVCKASSCIGVPGSFSRRGQQLHPAKIQSLPAKISSCSTKLFFRAVLPNCSANGKIGR